MATTREVVAVAVLAIVAAIIAGLIVASVYVPISNTGSIVTIGVEVDVNQINWGSFAPKENKTRTVIATNNGTTLLELYVATDNWTPAISEDYLRLTTNLPENQILLAGASISVDFTLTALENVTGIDTFAFDIIVAGVKSD